MPTKEHEQRIRAITSIIGMAMAVASDHPRDVTLWITTAIGSLMTLGVNDAELAEAVQSAEFITKDAEDNEILSRMAAGL